MTAEDRLDQLSRQLLQCPYVGLNQVQKSVIDLIASEAPTGLNKSLEIKEDSGFWDRLADRVAAIGGSWGFIGGFSLALVLWTGGNLILKPLNLAFDPYPFIFLNLILSTVAALQAPVIMMSQNRQASKDRENAEHDYVVNLRAELEIMHLNDQLEAVRDGDLAKLSQDNARALARLERKLDDLVGRLDAKA